MAEGSGSILVVDLWHATLNLGSDTDTTAGWITAVTSASVRFSGRSDRPPVEGDEQMKILVFVPTVSGR